MSTTIIPMANGSSVLRADLDSNLYGEVSGIVVAHVAGATSAASFPFVTWRVDLDRSNGTFVALQGHYFATFNEAQRDFEVRTGRKVGA